MLHANPRHPESDRMTGRLMFLGLVLAAMPVAVDLPGDADTTRSATLHADLAGGGGQIALIARDCEGDVVRVQHDPVSAAGLDVGVTLPQDLVIGTRAGVIETKHDSRTFGAWGTSFATLRGDSGVGVQHVTNRYVNPYVGVESPHFGMGMGVLIASEPMREGPESWRRSDVSGHVRLSGEKAAFTLKWMEGVPLESEGHLTAAFDAGAHHGSYDTGVFAGLAGPYEGVLLGARHRIWLTPEAALQLKAAAAGHQQYGVWLTLTGVHPIRR